MATPQLSISRGKRFRCNSLSLLGSLAGSETRQRRGSIFPSGPWARWLSLLRTDALGPGMDRQGSHLAANSSRMVAEASSPPFRIQIARSGETLEPRCIVVLCLRHQGSAISSPSTPASPTTSSTPESLQRVTYVWLSTPESFLSVPIPWC